MGARRVGEPGHDERRQDAKNREEGARYCFSSNEVNQNKTRSVSLLFENGIRRVFLGIARAVLFIHGPPVLVILGTECRPQRTRCFMRCRSCHSTSTAIRTPRSWSRPANATA